LKVPAELIAALMEGDDFLLATHISPEGDAYGSQIALAMALQKLGKRTYLYNRDGVVDFYTFMPGSEDIHTTLPENTSPYTLVVMDCNSAERAAVDGQSFKRTLVVDHHETESDFGDVKWIVPEAPATGIMAFELIKALGVDVTPEMAVNLYTAIAVDTGTFRYNNTTPEVLRAAADLAEAGAAPGEIAEHVYQSWSSGRFKLLCMTLGTIETVDGVAVSSVTQGMFEATGTSSADTEEFSNFPRMIKDASVSAFLKETPEGKWKVSLRSKGTRNVAQVAEHFGGGGHRNAAGCTIEGTLPEAKKKLLAAIKEIV
jgi:phosphoesterase RecJ-like protein